MPALLFLLLPAHSAMSFFSRASALPLLVAGAFFMENLDGTVIVTAMPQMAAAFGVRPVDMNIGISAYILTLTVFIPASGWIANRFGARNIFAAAVLIFTLASVLCAASVNLPTFTAARILQGFGGALMVPVGRLVVLRNTAKPDLIKAIATITWPGLVAPILGPPVGGFITTYASWHWIFILNVPLGIAALWLAWRLIPQEAPQKGVPFDALGFVLTGIACFGLMFGLDLINHPQLSWLVPVLCIIGSLALGALAVRHAKRTEHPLINLWAMRIKSYAVTIWGGTLFRIAIGAVPFLLPLLFQIGFGLNAFDAGLLVLAVFAGNLVMKPFTSAVLYRFRFRTTLVVNGLLNASHYFRLCAVDATDPDLADSGAAVRQRADAINAVHRAQYAGVFRSATAANEWRQYAVQCVAANGQRTGYRHRRTGPAVGRDADAAIRRAHPFSRFPVGVCGHRRDCPAGRG